MSWFSSLKSTISSTASAASGALNRLATAIVNTAIPIGRAAVNIIRGSANATPIAPPVPVPPPPQRYREPAAAYRQFTVPVTNGSLRPLAPAVPILPPQRYREPTAEYKRASARVFNRLPLDNKAKLPQYPDATLQYAQEDFHRERKVHADVKLPFEVKAGEYFNSFRQFIIHPTPETENDYLLFLKTARPTALMHLLSLISVQRFKSMFLFTAEYMRKRMDKKTKKVVMKYDNVYIYGNEKDYKSLILNSLDVKPELDRCLNHIREGIENADSQLEGSGWIFNRVLALDIHIYRFEFKALLILTCLSILKTKSAASMFKTKLNFVSNMRLLLLFILLKRTPKDQASILINWINLIGMVSHFLQLKKHSQDLRRTIQQLASTYLFLTKTMIN